MWLLGGLDLQVEAEAEAEVEVSGLRGCGIEDWRFELLFVCEAGFGFEDFWRRSASDRLNF